MNLRIEIGTKKHEKYAIIIASMIECAAKKKGTTLALRKPDYILDKITKGKAIIALDHNIVVGFCYFENWENNKFISHSGLIVNEKYQGKGVSKEIKKEIFNLSIKKFPKAKIFGLTTSKAVMNINSKLGYKNVSYNYLTNDKDFWKGCESCSNYSILVNSKQEQCKCTGMLIDPLKL